MAEQMGLVAERLKPRMDYRNIAPDILHAMLGLALAPNGLLARYPYRPA